MRKQITHSTNQRLVPVVTLILLFLIPLIPVSRSDYSFLAYIPQIVLGLITIYCIVQLNGQLPFYIAIFWTFSIVIFLFGWASYTGGTLTSITSGLRLLLPAMFLTIGYGCHDLLDEKKLLRILLVLLLIQLVISVLPNYSLGIRQVIGALYRTDTDSYLYGFSYSSTTRAIGTIGNPNLLCLYTIVIASILLFRIDFTPFRYKKILKTISLIITIVICILTQSREGIVIFLIVLFIYLYSRYPSRKTAFIAVPIELLVVYIAFSFINNNISRSMGFENLKVRFDIWNNIINNTLGGSVANYLFGIGYQNARSIPFFDNIYLKFLVSGGILGLVFFLVCMFLLLRRSIKSESKVSFVILIIWIVSSFVCEFQETLKVSSVAIVSLSYYLHNNQGNS